MTNRFYSDIPPEVQPINSQSGSFFFQIAEVGQTRLIALGLDLQKIGIYILFIRFELTHEYAAFPPIQSHAIDHIASCGRKPRHQPAGRSFRRRCPYPCRPSHVRGKAREEKENEIIGSSFEKELAFAQFSASYIKTIGVFAPMAWMNESQLFCAGIEIDGLYGVGDDEDGTLI